MTVSPSADRALAVRATATVAVRVTATPAAPTPAPHRHLGPAGWALAAVIVFVSFGLLASLGTL